MAYTKEDLERILEEDFLLSPAAFSPGRTNNDMVDSMLICFILDREWTELFAKWVDNYECVDENGVKFLDHSVDRNNDCATREFRNSGIKRILKHYQRVKKWIEGNVEHQNNLFKNKPELITWKPGNTDLMKWAINY